MKKVLFSCLILLIVASTAFAGYERNKAVAVEKVLFGSVVSVRNITQQELIKDSSQGWKIFGGALIGGAIGHQFGGGHGQTAATILGAVIGGSVVNNRNPQYKQVTIYLVELMIKVDDGKEYMVIQDYDSQMIFTKNDVIRMVYLENGIVRIDIQQ